MSALLNPGGTSLQELVALRTGPGVTDGLLWYFSHLPHDEFLQLEQEKALIQREITLEHENERAEDARFNAAKKIQKHDGEIAEGTQLPGGQKKKIVEMHNGSPLSPDKDIDVAEISCLKQGFLEALQQPGVKKPSGQKRTKKNANVQYTNWFQPTMWAIIAEVGKRAKPLMSLSEIVKECNL
ncbi:hypothetical protein BS47DRAFT_1357470 [Hydnum rufescens UP504]|uniref:Uncharacterized protein n=1 Tax=Hydnum rufescens UP504 TaxID=1448309 RepID=A0A9P6BB91_9AGAM|nr:hypothetical protein BS47DRAFT_1357470 [Hydnum rufescens UP504]